MAARAPSGGTAGEVAARSTIHTVAAYLPTAAVYVPTYIIHRSGIPDTCPSVTVHPRTSPPLLSPLAATAARHTLRNLYGDCPPSPHLAGGILFSRSCGRVKGARPVGAPRSGTDKHASGTAVALRASRAPRPPRARGPRRRAHARREYICTLADGAVTGCGAGMSSLPAACCWHLKAKRVAPRTRLSLSLPLSYLSYFSPSPLCRFCLAPRSYSRCRVETMSAPLDTYREKA